MKVDRKMDKKEYILLRENNRRTVRTEILNQYQGCCS